MFGTPERIPSDEEIKYRVEVTSRNPIGVKYELLEDTILPNLDNQDKLLVCKNKILTELANHTQLFKKPPTLEYLQAITPNWGCILNDNKPKWNPYTLLHNTIPISVRPCYVDFILTDLFISRSTISPRFETVFIEKAQDSNLIDIDWSANPIVPEVEEISDISFPSAGSIELRDPAVVEKAKSEAKFAVKIAFQNASIARKEALDLARKFTNEFAISDNESMFSEWLEEPGSESEFGSENEDKSS